MLYYLIRSLCLSFPPATFRTSELPYASLASGYVYIRVDLISLLPNIIPEDSSDEAVWQLYAFYSVRRGECTSVSRGTRVIAWSALLCTRSCMASARVCYSDWEKAPLRIAVEETTIDFSVKCTARVVSRW